MKQKSEQKTVQSDPHKADSRVNRLWRLYCSRITQIDPIRDLRGIEKICRDELEVSRRALKVFETEIAKEVK